MVYELVSVLKGYQIIAGLKTELLFLIITQLLDLNDSEDIKY